MSRMADGGVPLLEWLAKLPDSLEALMADVGKRPATADALEIIWNRFYKDKPRRQAALAKRRLEMVIGEAVYELRSRSKLTQKQLAERVGTSHSVISRLEDADYDGHSLKMLGRICAALDHELQLRFIPLKGADKKRAQARRKAEG